MAHTRGQYFTTSTTRGFTVLTKIETEQIKIKIKRKNERAKQQET
jgi:hypothetical protein